MPTVEEIPLGSHDKEAGDMPTVRPDDDGDHNLNDVLEIEADIDNELDETLSERLVGLTEMLPGPVRNILATGAGSMWNGSCWLWTTGRSGMWVIASSAAILALPILFETERAQMEEQQLQQQRQILLGPNAASSGAPGLGHGALPKIVPPGR